MELKNRHGTVIRTAASDDLSGANLYGADLYGANLNDADLSSANLNDANLRGAVGNMREVKSLQISTWSVTYTKDRMQIGCQNHALATWWDFSDGEISTMDSRALAWWTTWKPVLQQIIAASFAK